MDNSTVTITNDASADGADIYYTLNGDNPTTTTSATCFAYSAPFQVSATTTVKAIAKKSTDTNASSIVSKTFTKITPKTVTEALAAIDALADNGTIAEQYVRGIVSTAGSLNSGAITYYISADGSTSNELQVYKGKGLNNANFTSASEIAVGDEVIVFGTLKKYKSGTSITPEFDQNSYLISKVRKETPTFSLDVSEKTLDAYSHETVDVTLTTNTDGAITCESNDEDVATVELKSGNVYTITAKTEGTATITIRSAVSENYAPASAEVAVTVTDTRAEAGISFANDAITKTWGESFTGQELTNTNSVTVTWSSTDETVATVNTTTGIVNMLKAGTTTIKATYPGDVSYKPAVASYDLTINKATAGITYSENAFEIMLNDDSFVAPTLNNPNSLSGITYSSNNTNLAVVDENTGELWYDSSITGTAIITADFAGNDWYNSGSANYTITIIDPTVKGSKYNPYTVAEVIDGTATGDGIYVKGYIVGEYVGKTTNPRVSGFTTDANIAVADPFTTTPTASASIPVALPSDALKAAWGCKTSKGAFLGYEILIKGNADTYFSVKGIKSTSEVSLISLPITISAAGWATYCSNHPLDFTGVTALTAYTATVDGNAVKFNKVMGKVPANTGLLVSGETANVPVCASAAPVTNIMEGVTAEKVMDANSIFVLKKGANGLGFYKNAKEFTLRANSAYIPAASIPATARGFISLDDETTGIKGSLTPALSEGEGAIYTLDGRKVAIAPLGMDKNGQLKKGVYVVNGKKVVIK
ncbi:DUF6359 domain-containing protein [Xylanibacter brevis]|uniref:DUF6359 domain-containing protein n=1 Tax=Xylanibacter brevis TaxID=83231 RepID=UPI001E63AA17|nr:DUF6359 domain-containing protein [Xylanibacter brevis]